jgi:hypothetical protein
MITYEMGKKVIEVHKMMAAKKYKAAIVLTSEIIEGGLPMAVKSLRQLHWEDIRERKHPDESPDASV